jgi:hypothetical protein
MTRLAQRRTIRFLDEVLSRFVPTYGAIQLSCLYFRTTAFDYNVSCVCLLDNEQMRKSLTHVFTTVVAKVTNAYL